MPVCISSGKSEAEEDKSTRAVAKQGTTSVEDLSSRPLPCTLPPFFEEVLS